MHRLIAVLFFICSFCIAADPAASDCQNKEQLSIVGKNNANTLGNYRFQMGETLQIKASGGCMEQIKAQWLQSKRVGLYFDAEHIADLKSPPQQMNQELLLNFMLERDTQNDNNRLAWENLFKKRHLYLMPVQPALSLGDNLPLVVYAPQKMTFYVAEPLYINTTLATGLILLFGTYIYLVKKTRMLCDAGTGDYSLAKSQMAFWGLLVALSFAGIWVLTGTMEQIPDQILILLGISSGTGLSAIVIQQNKQSATRLSEVWQEEQKRPLPAPGSHPAEAEPPLPAGFWRNICDDGHGASFHRLQVVIWTLLLGAVFVRTVTQLMTMPVFPESLLTLLGVSNLTYLGFKIPEKQ